MSRTIAQHVLFQIFCFSSFFFVLRVFFFFFRKGRLGESLSLPLQNDVKSPKFFWSGNRNPTAKATWQTWKDLMSRKIAQHAQNKIFYLPVVLWKKAPWNHQFGGRYAVICILIFSLYNIIMSVMKIKI